MLTIIPNRVVILAVVLSAALPARSALAMLDIAGLSQQVDACTDFDEYVNGNWRQRTPMPADRAWIGSLNDLRDRSRIIVEQALAEAVRKPEELVDCNN